MIAYMFCVDYCVVLFVDIWFTLAFNWFGQSCVVCFACYGWFICIWFGFGSFVTLWFWFVVLWWFLTFVVMVYVNLLVTCDLICLFCLQLIWIVNSLICVCLLWICFFLLLFCLTVSFEWWFKFAVLFEFGL